MANVQTSHRHDGVRQLVELFLPAPPMGTISGTWGGPARAVNGPGSSVPRLSGGQGQPQPAPIVYTHLPILHKISETKVSLLGSPDLSKDHFWYHPDRRGIVSCKLQVLTSRCVDFGRDTVLSLDECSWPLFHGLDSFPWPLWKKEFSNSPGFPAVWPLRGGCMLPHVYQAPPRSAG